MSMADLMRIEDPMFSFSHQIEHNNLVNAMTTPNVYNLANYLLDPMLGQEIGAGNWNTNHSIAHQDAADWYNVQPNLILNSVNLTQETRQRSWWQFTNYSEHLALSQAAFSINQG